MKILFRAFARSPGFFTVIVMTLALGIGANTAIFSVIRGVLLRPLPYHEPERLVGIQNRMGEREGGALSVREYLDVREMAQGLEAAGAYSTGDGNLTGTGAAERVAIGFVTPDLFPTLGVMPAAGRWFVAGEDEPGRDHVVVLGHGLWQRRYAGDRAVLGKDLLLDGESFRIVGILPASFRFEASLDMFIPLGFTPAMRAESARDQHFLRVVGRVKPGVTVDALDGQLVVVGARLIAAHPDVYKEEWGWRPAAQPLLDNLVEDVRPSLWLLAVAAGLVLLIVCANVASLLLARASVRQRELSVRAALGATRARIVGQLLVESLVLSGLGGFLGVLFALWGTDFLLALAPDKLPRTGEIRLDAMVLAFSVLVTAVTGTLFGLIPALGASRVDLQEALRASARTSSSGRHPRRVRHALVVAETALALILVTSAALVVRSFGKVMDVEPGFRTDGVLSLRVALATPSGTPTPEDYARWQSWFDEAEARLRSIPGVTSAGSINRLPFADGLSDRLVDVESAPQATGADRFDAEFRVITPGYLETTKIPLLEGRALAAQDSAAGLPVVVVSRSFAKATWPQGALGQRMRLSSPQGPWLTVVGVVGDVHHGGLDTPAPPTMYIPASQFKGATSRSIVLHATAPMSHVAAAARAELERFDPQQPIYDVLPMTERLAQTVEQRHFVLVLFELFAALALGLAALGLYGVLAHAVTERTREIGVRVALGATRARILRLVAREGALLIGIGVALGIAGGVAGTRMLSHLLYGVSPGDPIAMMAAIALLVIASLVAMWIPAMRALRVDPMVALRDE